MTDRLPEAARTALLDMTDVRVPPDLAGAALTLAGRRRRRRVLGTALGAAVLAAAAVLVPAVLRTDRAAPPVAPTVVVPWRIVAYDAGSGTGHQFSELLDPATGAWVRVPYPLLVPSPDYRWVLVGRGDAELGIAARADLLRDPGSVRWLPGSRGYEQPRWSADGRVLLTLRGPVAAGSDEPVTKGFLVVDAATARATSAPYTFPLREPLFWGPGDRLVGAADHVLGRDPAPDSSGGVDGPGTDFAAVLVPFHDLTGRPAGLPLSCRLPDTVLTSSFDGRLLAGSGMGTGICDTSTGKLVGTVGGASYEPSPWADTTHPVTVGPGGGRLTVRDLAGRPVAELPADRAGQPRLATVT